MNVFFNNKSFIVDESESIKNFLEANYAVGDSSTRFLVDGERLVVDDVSFSQIMDESSRIDVVREMVRVVADNMINLIVFRVFYASLTTIGWRGS